MPQQIRPNVRTNRNKAVLILTQWIADYKIWRKMGIHTKGRQKVDPETDTKRRQKVDPEIETKGRQKVDPETVTNWHERVKYSQ
jgi:hypothetical protein